MKKAAIFLLYLSTVFLLACEKEELTPDFTLEQADELSSDEYEVYGILLGRMGVSQLIVRQQTSVYTPPKENFGLFFSLERNSNMEATALYASYVNENRNAYLLGEKIEVPSKDVKIVSNKEHAYYFDREDLNKGWELFKTSYPKADALFFALNKIGFNENRTQAMLGAELYWFMESPEGPTISAGRLYYFEKKEGVWEYVSSTYYRL